MGRGPGREGKERSFEQAKRTGLYPFVNDRYLRIPSVPGPTKNGSKGARFGPFAKPSASGRSLRTADGRNRR